jgi:hypothetical protein
MMQRETNETTCRLEQRSQFIAIMIDAFGIELGSLPMPEKFQLRILLPIRM